MKQVVVLNENAQTFVQNSNVHSLPMTKIEIDVEALERDLRAKVRGEVYFDEGSRALYTTDASNYRQVPIGVVIPKDADLIRKRYPRIPRRVSDYNLDELLPENGFNVVGALVGTESTCAVVLEATTRLVQSPPMRAIVVLGYADIYSGCDQIPMLLQYHPIGLEGFDDGLIDDLRKKGLHKNEVALFPEGRGWLIVEFGGNSKDVWII